MSHPLVDAYEAGGELLHQAVADLDPALTHTPIEPGAWSVAQLVAHLLDADLVYADRIKRVLAEDEPLLAAFDEDRWIARMPADALALPAIEGARLFRDHRKWTARLLAQVGEAELRRHGVHSVLGRQTLAALLVKVNGHLDHHLRFLYGKRGRLGLSVEPRYTPRLV